VLTPARRYEKTFSEKGQQNITRFCIRPQAGVYGQLVGRIRATGGAGQEGLEQKASGGPRARRVARQAVLPPPLPVDALLVLPAVGVLPMGGHPAGITQANDSPGMASFLYRGFRNPVADDPLLAPPISSVTEEKVFLKR
jgi:hypothetical protein